MEQYIVRSFYYYEKFFSDDGKYIEISGNATQDGSEVYVKLDGELTQHVISDFNNDKIIEELYNKDVTRGGEYVKVVNEYKLSMFVNDINIENNDIVDDNEIYRKGPDMSEWTLYKTYKPSPILDGSKTCKLYFQNYDEEPDLHKYSGKSVKFTKGTAIGLVVAVVGTFLSGPVSIAAIVVGLGSAIVSDCLSKAVDGDVCFSIQKIGYAPIISDKYVFTDAYITKRWVVIHDDIRNTDSFELDNSSYKSNRGETPDRIAYNAQAAELSSR